MKIGTLRNIADLSDESFALFLQALPAIRQEIRSFNEKMSAVVGSNACDYATYDFKPNNKREAENEFKRWLQRVAEGEVTVIDGLPILEWRKEQKAIMADLRNENKNFADMCRKLSDENRNLKDKCERLEKECVNLRAVREKTPPPPPPIKPMPPFDPLNPRDYWLEEYKRLQEFMPRDDWEKYRVTSSAETPQSVLMKIVNKSLKGGL